MLSAAYYMQKTGYCHRDIKPENILMDSDFNLKVADFGFALTTEGRKGDGVCHTKLGTESYMAPEIHHGMSYIGSQVDLFAIGIILFIMKTGHPPFKKATNNDPHYKLIASNRADIFW
mmetsp:Transcript_18823/g.26037  ORF Transcript_18823/g.26037 Transcript_18823/m.26037 type:complete len:118 (+) Transcript_18823:379-732(+)